MSNYDVIIGIDPGNTGGISAVTLSSSDIEVYRMPVQKTVTIVKKKKKTKTTYDIKQIVTLLRRFEDKRVLVVLEKVHAGKGEGTVSMFNFGKGYGNLEAISLTLGHIYNYELVEITPQAWKKHYPQLETEEIAEMRLEQKSLRQKDKIEKDKGTKKENKKLIEKLGRRIKSLAKAEARTIAKSYKSSPEDLFKLVNSDGMAESLLLAIYGRDIISEKNNENDQK